MTKLLRKIGATHVITEYDPQSNEEVGMFFVVPMMGKRLSFSIPIRWQSVQGAMKESGVKGKYLKEDQCKRTAWRVAYRWVEAQVALIQSGAAETAEAFMSYAVIDTTTGKTFYHELRDNNFKQLPAPVEPPI
jgi:hypothetical protein